MEKIQENNSQEESVKDFGKEIRKIFKEFYEELFTKETDNREEGKAITAEVEKKLHEINRKAELQEPMVIT